MSTRDKLVSEIEKRGQVGIIWIDNPPVNAIGVDVRKAIIAGVEDLVQDEDIRVGILACRGQTFFSGADIKEFGGPRPAPSLHEVTAVIESSTKPIIAAMFGTILGGGFEVALACSHRVASRDAKVGLPEVKLGILPGCGGTQRLPRLIGVQKAFDLILTGKPVAAKDPLAEKIFDRITNSDIVESAWQLAEELAVSGEKPRRIADMPIPSDSYDKDFLENAARMVSKKYPGQFAPARIVECFETLLRDPFDIALANERALFNQCLKNPQSAALRHVFFAERLARKAPGLENLSSDRTVESVCVIGAGTMGVGIAAEFVARGFSTCLIDQSPDALKRGRKRIEEIFARDIEKGRRTEEQGRALLSKLTTQTDVESASFSDLFVEAVFEDYEVKREVFAKLDEIAKPGAILATNTSYISVDKIASATKRPKDVIGLHFFSPANIMRLCEVVRGPRTSENTLSVALDATKKLGKLSVISGDADGFIGNRMLADYRLAAMQLAYEGAKPSQIDSALTDFGFAMGPFAVGDLAGLDIGYRNRKGRPAEAVDPREGYVADRLVEQGRLGQKTGGGYYDYPDGGRNPIEREETLHLFEEGARALGIARRVGIDDAEILERCLNALADCGEMLLKNEVALRSSDIDLVYINGYGFPAYKGGPMYWREHGDSK